jgi:ribosomal protein S12
VIGIGLSGAALLLVGKEVAEFVVIDGVVRIIGRRAKGRNDKMKNLSFEEIRKQMQVNAGMVATQANTAVNKAVEVAKSSTSVIHGYLPVTNNKLDARTEDLVRLIASNTLQLQQIRATLAGLGFPLSDVPISDVNVVTKSLMEVIKGKKEEVPAPTPAPVVAEPTQITIEEVAPAPIVQPTNPILNSIPVSQPTDWHLA